MNLFATSLHPALWVLIAVAALAALALAGFLLFKLGQGIGWLLRRCIRFLGALLGDLGRLAGSMLALPVFLALISVFWLLGRRESVRHYRRALSREVRFCAGALYRVVLGQWLALFGLSAVGEGLEKRLPEAVRTAPRPPDLAFEGYRIVGSLRPGGSGAKLHVARPDDERRALFARFGRGDVREVVIKSFDLDEGSDLSEIVRESRALDAARSLGLVLEHGVDERRFYYVMPYVPGEDLAVVTARLHAAAGPDGLTTPLLRQALGYVADLLETLDRYHQAGLWHKDVKPANVIVAGGRAQLVDLGLVTPLRSALTLTTHGTEYYRDPELVRQALRGARVSEVDGVRFDLYGAGAVLYSVLENSFPAHGSLSPLSRRCPEGLRWIVRRAMADLHSRYPDARAMLADLRAVMNAADPFALRPADLPSFPAADAAGA